MTNKTRIRHSSAGVSQTTVYPSNTRASSAAVACNGDWHPAINRLLAQDYAFLNVQFDAPGYLFRGIECGLLSVLKAGSLQLNQGEHSLASLERDLGVLLVSSDFSDAMAVSKIWQSDANDPAIFVIDARQFLLAHAAKSAAVLGFADPGVVFKYPLFAEPLALSRIYRLIVRPRTAEIIQSSDEFEHVLGAGQLIAIERNLENASRQTVENHLCRVLREQGLVGAKAAPASAYPKRQTSV